jgi:predicted phage terminase large subunit-like protein
VLRLPALAEEGDPLGRSVGAALWPAWEGRDALLEKRGLLGERHFAALFQQSPLGEAGQVFDPRKLRIVNDVPAGVAVRAWDLAASTIGTGDPDWTVGLKLVRDATGSLFIDDIIRFRELPGGVADRIRSAALMDGVSVTVGLPQDPGQAGKSQIMFLTQMLAGFRVVATPETGMKATRAMPVASQVSAGTVCMRRAGWNATFMDELANFPNGRKDDQVDALARAFDLLICQHPAAQFTRVQLFAR